MSITKYDPLYISGLLTSWGSATTIGVAAGECTSTTDPYPLLVSSGALTIDTAGNGALGLAGSESLTDYLFWHVFLIMKADGTVSAFAAGSADGATPSPALPTDYIYSRALPGIWRQSAGALIYATHTRHCRCGVEVTGMSTNVLTGYSATRRTIDLSAVVPLNATAAQMGLTLRIENTNANQWHQLTVEQGNAVPKIQGVLQITMISGVTRADYLGKVRGWCAFDTLQTLWALDFVGGGTATWHTLAYTCHGWRESGE
jgi:hypothetical protein